MRPENKRRIGEAIVLSLFFVIDGYEVWPTSHMIALSAAVVGVSAVCFAEMPTRWWVASTIGLAIVAGIIYFAAPPIALEETVRRGLLVPANDPTPSTGCDPAGNPKDTPFFGFRLPFGGFGTRAIRRPTIVVPKDAAIVAVGSNGIVLTTSDQVPLIRVGECTLLSMQKTEEGILINSSIYDRSNKLIGNIKDNNFQGIENTHSDIKQEGDLSTLIIIDESGVRLWVHFLNPRAVKVRGEFMCPRRSATIVITDDDLAMVAHEPPQAPPFVWENYCFAGTFVIP